jgi:hypothetical protein
LGTLLSALVLVDRFRDLILRGIKRRNPGVHCGNLVVELNFESPLTNRDLSGMADRVAEPGQECLVGLPSLRSNTAQNLSSIRPAQSFFPEFYYSKRKFTLSDPGASAGFWPHLKQGVVFAE